MIATCTVAAITPRRPDSIARTWRPTWKLSNKRAHIKAGPHHDGLKRETNPKKQHRHRQQFLQYRHHHPPMLPWRSLPLKFGKEVGWGSKILNSGDCPISSEASRRGGNTAIGYYIIVAYDQTCSSCCCFRHFILLRVYCNSCSLGK